jgi:putative oxygen-independent coproporphyrinogen III oxidase
MSLAQPPLALYVHFPWCVRKCPYCDFNSYALKDALPEERYVEALIRDMEQQQPDVPARPLVSVFLGGGTPSLLAPVAIERVLAAARRIFGFGGDIEITLEANPGTIERGRFAEYRAAGINRVSLGAQSFERARLEALGRIHSPAETCRAAEELHASGLHNFNLDLMYALPGQDCTGALADIEQAIALAPAHLSHYQLTIEAGTAFAATPPPGLPSEEAACEMLAVCEERLARAGFAQYEISAYAREGRRARHNLNYWTFGDYLGAGAGAHGKLSFPRRGAIIRTARTREPRRYLAAAGDSLSRTTVERRDLPFEFMLNALRLIDGFDATLFETRTGLAWESVAPTLEELRKRGLVGSGEGLWRPTRLGARFLNELLLRFLPEPVSGSAQALSRPLQAQPRPGA